MARLNIDYESHPKESLEVLLHRYDTQILNINETLSDITTYGNVCQDLLDIMKWKFEDKEIRNREIRIRFLPDPPKKESVCKIQIRHLLINLIFWYAYVRADIPEVVDESYVQHFEKLRADGLTPEIRIGEMDDYKDNVILPDIEDIDSHTQNEIIDEINYNLRNVTKAFSVLFGLGISVYSLIQAGKRDPRIEEIMHVQLDPSMQPNEIEETAKSLSDELTRRVIADKENDLASYMAAGKVLSPGQFKEFAVLIGLKADINGNTIPHLINCNFLVHGINTPSYQYLIGIGGRKSLIMSKTKMGEPGAFSRKATINTAPVVLRKDHVACNSIAPVWITIKSDEMLKMYDGRYYYDTMMEEHVVDYAKDKDLIGKELPFRSPCTCASKNGICYKCYGKLHRINSELASAGAFAATKITMPMGQTVLSSKHLQVTTSTGIQFDPEFYNVFEINSNEITARDDSPMDEDLYIVLGQVFTEEGEDTIDYYCESFDLVDSTNKVVVHAAENNGAKLYLSKQLADIYAKLKDKKKPISMNLFDDDSSVILNVEVKNKELTQPIRNMNKLLNTVDHAGCHTIDDFLQTFCDNLIDAGIHYPMVHAEMMLRALLRKKSNEMEEPDWTANGDIHDYKILRLNDSLFKNPSVAISLTYGYLRKTLRSVEFYQKTAPSTLDPFFAERLADYTKEA